MGISRENQHIIADIVLRALARGLCAVSMFDKRVAADIETLGDGFSFAVCSGLYIRSAGDKLADKKTTAIKLKIDNGRFSRADSDINASDVIIRFKDISGAMPVLLGQESVASSFAQHRMLVSGNMNHAVALVRIIEITEAYLFPKFIINKAMRRVPKKQMPGIFIYIIMLFLGSKGPPRAKVTAETTEDTTAEAAVAAGNRPENREAGEELEAVK